MSTLKGEIAQVLTVTGFKKNFWALSKEIRRYACSTQMDVIIYVTTLLNDYVKLCHINAFYYGYLCMYCQCQNYSRTRLHFVMFTT